MYKFFGVALLAVPMGAQILKPHQVTIKVERWYGAVIPNGHIEVAPSGAAESIILKADSSGFVRLEGSTGTYKVLAWSPGFDPRAESVEITRDDKQLVRLVLREANLGVSGFEQPQVPSTMDAHLKLLLGDQIISPARPIPAGLAPGMQVKLVSDARDGEKVYALIFAKGDELLSGLTDFAIKYKVEAAHFTGIGAISGATVGWLDLSQKAYQPIHVDEQVEVLSLIGDVATFNGKPVVHAHMVMGRRDGSTVGGHLWEAHVNPTLEVFVSVDPVGLKKKLDDASGMKLIDPKQ